MKTLPEIKHSLLFFTVWILLHLPFLNMDAVLPLDFSRGALTDEGLYILQVRNMWQGAGLDWFSCDGLLKTPLYNLIQLPLVGLNSLWALRLGLVISSGIAWSLLLSKMKPMGILVFILCLCQSTFFLQHHFAMAEVLLVAFLVIGIYHLFFNKNSPYLGLCFIFACPAIKIQYLYFLALIPIFLFYIYKSEGKLHLRKLFASLLPLLLLILLGVVFLDEYQFILNAQSAGKFQDFGNWLLRIQVNLTPILNNPGSFIVLILFLASTAIVISNWRKNKRKEKWKWIIMYYLLILESHKLLFIYLPQRYLFLWWCIMSLIIVYSFSQLIEFKKVYLIALAIPCYFITTHFQNGQYKMQNLRNKIQTAAQAKVLIGPWSGSSAFGSDKIAYPAWKNYFENRAMWEEKKVHIIREDDNKDNEGLFKNKRFKDTLFSAKVHSWKLLIH